MPCLSWRMTCLRLSAGQCCHMLLNCLIQLASKITPIFSLPPNRELWISRASLVVGKAVGSGHAYLSERCISFQGATSRFHIAESIVETIKIET